jgi:hypothetical protein
MALPLFDRLDQEISLASARQGLAEDTLRASICRAVTEAAHAHFGSRRVFEALFDEGRLQLVQVVAAKDEPRADNEVATARLRAHEMDVEDGDELLFEVHFNNPQAAAADDREHGWATGLVTERCGFGAVAAGAVRAVLGLAPSNDPKADAVRLAVLLAVLPPARRESPAAYGSSRLVSGPHGSLHLHRAYTVGRDVTREEVQVVLERDDLPDGSTFELFEDTVTVAQLLVGLLDPTTGALARAARVTAVLEADLVGELKALGVNLAERKLEGVPWTRLEHAMKHSWMEYSVVDQVTRENREISLSDARLLEPSAQPGDKLKLPGAVNHELCPGLAALFTDEDTVRFVDTRDAAAFEALRPTAAVQPTPPALAGFELGPLRQLYPEGHGVLFADVPGTAAQTLWKRLDAAAPTTRYRPVILGGDERELREGPSAWTGDPLDGLQAGTHPNDSPAAVLAAVDTVDVRALLAPGGNPSYPGWTAERGEWPEDPPGSRLGALCSMRGELWPKVRLALIPTDAAWKTIAWLPMLLRSGEATPSLAQACAVSREWEKRHGARVISVRPAMIEWWLDTPPSRETALELATAHSTFTPEGGSNVLEVRANELVSSVWSSWWD